MLTAQPPVCSHCGQTSRLTTGAEVYPGLQHLAARGFYLCALCQAWVGCHEGTTIPLGTLADSPLRKLRSQLHEKFDPLWGAMVESQGISRSRARSRAYSWLAGWLQVNLERCHIGMFDETQCNKAMAIIEIHGAELRAAAVQPSGR